MWLKRAMNEEELKKIVEEAGGEWVGIQEDPDPDLYPSWAVFNEPTSKSTALLPVDQVTVENVKRKLKEAEDDHLKHRGWLTKGCNKES